MAPLAGMPIISFMEDEELKKNPQASGPLGD
jgi:hypothetical protein